MVNRAATPTLNIPQQHPKEQHQQKSCSSLFFGESFFPIPEDQGSSLWHFFGGFIFIDSYKTLEDHRRPFSDLKLSSNPFILKPLQWNWVYIALTCPVFIILELHIKKDTVHCVHLQLFIQFLGGWNPWWPPLLLPHYSGDFSVKMHHIIYKCWCRRGSFVCRSQWDDSSCERGYTRGLEPPGRPL